MEDVTGEADSSGYGVYIVQFICVLVWVYQAPESVDFLLV